MDGEPTSPAVEADDTRVLESAQAGNDIDLAGLTVGPSPDAPSLLPSATPLSRPLGLPVPETVLRRSELDQTRKTARAGVLFNLLGLATVPVFAGDPLARMLFAVGLLLAGLNNAWLLYFSSSDLRYRDRHVIAYFILAVLPNAAILYYLGVFGPLLAMFVLNVYTGCVAYRARIARLVLVASILPPLVLGAGMAMGLLPDPGLASFGPQVGPVGKAIAVLATVAFLLLTYQQANRSRELLVASLVERDTAVRQASHREALLVEARQELEQALQAGGLGRFSHQTLGSFKLGAIVGRGGMGEVYEAVHVETGEPAAVKMLLPSVLGRPDFVRRFLREVRVAASLDSPNVVAVLEIGDESAPMPYLAMERLVGETLAELLRKRGRIGLRTVTDLLRQTARGVEVAAEAGIVHRDLKPQNLFLTRDEPRTWKILDFGVSKLTDNSETLTHGDPIGTPQYMAPEQAGGYPVDIRADLYALGAITYRALTGHQPFETNEVAAILVKVLDVMPKRPSSLAGLSRDMDLFLAIAMAKDPSDRFQTAPALVDAFVAATEERLDPADRKRAEALLRDRPWGE